MTIQIQQQVKRSKGRPSTKNTTYVPSIIDFNKVTKLNNIDIDPKMMESMSSGISNMDKFFSHEGGVPCASNIMVAGSPGVGKTTVLLDVLSGITNRGRKTLFISAEMGQKQMFKYTQRFPQFGNVTTLFINDYLEYNTKDIIEQILNQGFDCVLIDSVAEIIDGVRDDNGWDRKMAEAWLVEVCTNHNKGNNSLNKYTSFLLIQQMTKGQDMVGSNKLKHLTDAALFLRRESERDGGGTYMEFEKNRNGNADRMTYELSNSSINYGSISQRIEE
jgi:DNA repair protein RadA/Sms